MFCFPSQNGRLLIHLIIIFLMAMFADFSTIHADLWSVSLQNDLIFGTDEYYTNGLSFNWLSDSMDNNDITRSGSDYTNFLYILMTSIPHLDIDADRISSGFRIAQDVYTPSDTKEEKLIKDDIPYAGHLYTKYSLIEWREDETEQTYFKIGIVGPYSGAEWSQKSFHWLIGNDEPKGWEHQLDNQMTLGIGYRHSVRTWQNEFDNGKTSDWINSYGFEFGNFFSGFFVQSLFRYGENYPRDIVLTDNLVNAVGNRFMVNSIDKSYGWAVSMGTQLSAVAYSMITDYSEEHDIERKTFIGYNFFSLSLYIKHIEFTFSIQSMNMNINNVIHSVKWGGFSFSLDV